VLSRHPSYSREDILLASLVDEVGGREMASLSIHTYVHPKHVQSDHAKSTRCVLSAYYTQVLIRWVRGVVVLRACRCDRRLSAEDSSCICRTRRTARDPTSHFMLAILRRVYFHSLRPPVVLCCVLQSVSR